jgi:phage repressor protein C with HTH and peptisase S24 domain
MSYAKIIERLSQKEDVTIRPSGSSMEPRIHNKQEITIRSVDPTEVVVGDVVLAKVKGRFYIHLVSAVEGDRIQISNNHGHVNGWTNRTKIYGRVII